MFATERIKNVTGVIDVLVFPIKNTSEKYFSFGKKTRKKLDFTGLSNPCYQFLALYLNLDEK